MSDAKMTKEDQTALTPKFRVSYPNLFKPRMNDKSKKEEYSVVALFEKGADLKVLQKAAVAAITRKWGPDKAKWPKGLRTPFRNQGERKKVVDGKDVLPEGYEDGAIFINLKSKLRPPLVDGQKREILDETQFYPGCYAKAIVFAHAYESMGNVGVSFYINAVQKVAEGEPFGGRANAIEQFEAIDSPDSLESGTDDIGF